MTQSQRALLKRCETALADWMLNAAPERYRRTAFVESSIRIEALGGILVYIGGLLRDIRKELRK